jgi:hypothetical protein
MSCISRRAHADRYSFKLFKEEDGEVKEKNYIWTEYRCPNEVLKGTQMCVECSVTKDGRKYQASPNFDQGVIGGPYTPQSKLYGSVYYLKFIKDGWKIREEDERRAKEAQQKANMAPAKKKIDESGTPLTIQTKPQPSSSSISLASEETPKTPKTPRKPRIAKKALLPEANSTPAEFVESIEIPTIASEVIVVKVKKIRCGGSDYYYDSKSGKVYGVSVKGVGAYKGRYNSQNETIDIRYPDSDDE